MLSIKSIDKIYLLYIIFEHEINKTLDCVSLLMSEISLYVTNL